jgi:protein-S-isoprenylcysteine O-methyltransferase Ste14
MTTTNKKLSVTQITFTAVYLLLWPALFMFLSGNWQWIEGWIFCIWFLILCITTIMYLSFKDPDLLMERYKKPGTGNQEGWDKYVVYGLAIGFGAWIVLMPLDVMRFEWTKNFPLVLEIIGGTFLILSFFFFFRSFTDNTFLSPLVRIQTERKQQLVTNGVYTIVRHPMYLGALLMFIGAPFLTGSVIGIIVGFGMIVLLALRTLGEEKMLQEELKDYAAYKQKVRYRFVPFIW